MKFEVGELAILNQNASKGLPNRVGEVVEIINSISSPNYDYHVELDNGDIVPVKEKELNHLSMPELDLITYIKRGNKVLYAPLEEEVLIHKIDMVHGHVEVQFLDNNAMSVVGIESLRPIEEKEEDVVNKKTIYNIGDKVRTITGDHWGGLVGEVSGVQHYDDGTPEYLVDIEDKIGCPFSENELELHKEELINGHTKEYWLDLFFGHYENEDGTFTLPRQLLHNLLNKAL